MWSQQVITQIYIFFLNERYNISGNSKLSFTVKKKKACCSSFRVKTEVPAPSIGKTVIIGTFMLGPSVFNSTALLAEELSK